MIAAGTGDARVDAVVSDVARAEALTGAASVETFAEAQIRLGAVLDAELDPELDAEPAAVEDLADRASTPS